MPKGGARVNSGPAPDQNALRRDRPSDKDGWTTLPAGGYSGRIPTWPLLPDIGLRARLSVAEAKADTLEADLEEAEGAKRAGIERRLDAVREQVAVLSFQVAEQEQREHAVWADIWRSPQAAAWARLGWVRDVAQYVRHKVLAELGSMEDAKEARQWSDRLGLNPAAMLRNRWRVSSDEVGQAREARRPSAVPAAGASSLRDRVQAASGGSA
jgi:hypothetical protein